MKLSIKYALIALTLLVCVPQITQAYTTTSQTSVRLNENTVLFFIKYQFGHEKFSYQLPVRATRGGEGDSQVGYDILVNGKLRTTVGTTNSIVLSDTTRKDATYWVEKDESAEFTLVTILTLPEGLAATSTKYSLAVSSLPFEIATDGTYTPNKLNDSELEPYRTQPINPKDSVALTTHNGQK